MRVISGKYKGKKIDGFDMDGTRPTKDRVKESVFGMIQNKVKDSTFLDLFAGSGSIGIEALSNGCKCCYFVDNGFDILKVLRKNIDCISNSILIDKDYKDALKFFDSNNIKFDIIYIDPPYHLELLNIAINMIESKELLNEDGIMIVEYEEEIPICSYELIKEKKYGKTSIRVYRRK